jgi:hypothetical protein
MRKRWLAIAMAAASLVACGTAGGELSADTRADLEGKVAEVRTAAEAGRSDEAMAALVSLSERVDAGLASGEVDQAKADRIRAAIADVMRSLPTTTTTESPTTTTPARTKGKGDKHNKNDNDD